MRTTCYLATTLVCLAGLAGCAETVPPAEVEGAVMLDGQPVPGGIVSFIPVGVDGGGNGGAIRDGKYHVYPEGGMKPGKYRVEIRWAKPTGEKVPMGYMMVDKTEEGIPEKYNIQSELTADVTAGKNTLDFNLSK